MVTKLSRLSSVRCGIHRCRVADDIPQGQVVFIGQQYSLVDRCFTDTTNRIVDHPLSASSSFGFTTGAQVGDEILYLFALIEADTSVDAVGDSHPADASSKLRLCALVR